MNTTFEEILPPTASSPHASIRWTPASAGCGCLIVNTRRDTATYGVAEFPAHGGRGFRLTKIAGGTDPEAASYSVFVADPAGREHDRCECRGFERFGHCKHVAAVRAILENADLWSRVVQVPVAPAPHWSDAIDTASESEREADFVAFLTRREALIATARNPGWIVSGVWYTVRRDVGAVVETWADRQCVNVREAAAEDDEDRMSGRLSSYTQPRE